MFDTVFLALESPLILTLTALYIISSAISIYDTRLIQWKKLGDIPQDTPTPPAWTGIFGIWAWIILFILLVLNWQFALVLAVIVFILKVLPVMENIGKLITYPLIKK